MSSPTFFTSSWSMWSTRLLEDRIVSNERCRSNCIVGLADQLTGIVDYLYSLVIIQRDHQKVFLIGYRQRLADVLDAPQVDRGERFSRGAVGPRGEDAHIPAFGQPDLHAADHCRDRLADMLLAFPILP